MSKMKTQKYFPDLKNVWIHEAVSKYFKKMNTNIENSIKRTVTST